MYVNNLEMTTEKTDNNTVENKDAVQDENSEKRLSIVVF